MQESFAEILAIGGRTNSLGRAAEVLQIVLNDQSRLNELYECVFADDAWVRMRAIDALEKVCRVHPKWLLPYAGRLLDTVATNHQPSIQWHLAQMFGELQLSLSQRTRAIAIMKQNLANAQVDWIVASNSMDTLAAFVRSGYMAAPELLPLLHIQQAHHSKAVAKRAMKLEASFAGSTAP